MKKINKLPMVPLQVKCWIETLQIHVKIKDLYMLLVEMYTPIAGYNREKQQSYKHKLEFLLTIA